MKFGKGSKQSSDKPTSVVTKLSGSPSASAYKPSQTPLRKQGYTQEFKGGNRSEDFVDQSASLQGNQNQPQIIERTVIKEVVVEKPRKEDRGGQGCSPFTLLRRLACLGCLIPVLVLLIVAALFYFRPLPLLRPLKLFLNNDVTTAEASEVGGLVGRNPESLINEKFLNIVGGEDSGTGFALSNFLTGERLSATVPLTEKELALVLNYVLKNPEGVYIRVDETRVRVVKNLDTQDPNYPLWLVIDLTVEKGNLKIDRVGLGRIAFPQFVIDFLLSNAFKVTQQINVNNLNDAINALISGQGTKIREVKLEQDKIVVIFVISDQTK